MHEKAVIEEGKELHESDLPDHKVSLISILLAFQWCCHFIFIVLGLFIWLFTLASWKDLSTKDKFIEDYLTNWKLKPLVDIIPTKNSRWPDGYENLIYREFKTLEGCNCLNVKAKGNKIYSGNWDVVQAAAGCTSILPMDPSKITKFFGFNLCGLRSGHNFIEVERPQLIKGEPVWSEDK